MVCTKGIQKTCSSGLGFGARLNESLLVPRVLNKLLDLISQVSPLLLKDQSYLSGARPIGYERAAEVFGILQAKYAASGLDSSEQPTKALLGEASPMLQKLVLLLPLSLDIYVSPGFWNDGHRFSISELLLEQG